MSSGPLALGLGVMPGCQVLGLAVGVNAGLLGSCVSGLSQCRVAAFGVSGLRELADFFITISHCAWRHVISLCPKRQRNEAKKALSNHRQVSVPSVQARSFWHLIARCSPDSPMFETLLLANPDTNTLRPQRSRASTMAHGPRRPHVFVRLSLARLVDLFAGWVVSE